MAGSVAHAPDGRYVFGPRRISGFITLTRTRPTEFRSGMLGRMQNSLKCSGPMHLEDVVADFLDLPVALFHPSLPWTE